MRILFVTANRVGDAVLTTGVLDHLIRKYPQCRITVACGPPAAGVFARMPNLERLVVFAKKPWRMHWLGLWREVAFTRWDLVVDLRGSALAWLVPARQRRVMHRVPGRKHEQFATVAGIAGPAPLPVAWSGPQDDARAAALLPVGRPVIGLGPTANWSGKVWPAERLAELFHRLAAGPLPGAVALILAGPGAMEQEMAAPLARLLPDAIDTTGQLALPEVTACLRRCALYVGNDSGLMHLAAAAGTPTVGLCGATRDRAAQFVPAGRRARWAMGTGERMEDLSVEVALEAALDMLSDLPEPG